MTNPDDITQIAKAMREAAGFAPGAPSYLVGRGTVRPTGAGRWPPRRACPPDFYEDLNHRLPQGDPRKSIFKRFWNWLWWR